MEEFANGFCININYFCYSWNVTERFLSSKMMRRLPNKKFCRKFVGMCTIIWSEFSELLAKISRQIDRVSLRPNCFCELKTRYCIGRRFDSCSLTALPKSITCIVSVLHVTSAQYHSIRTTIIEFREFSRLRSPSSELYSGSYMRTIYSTSCGGASCFFSVDIKTGRKHCCSMDSQNSAKSDDRRVRLKNEYRWNS